MIFLDLQEIICKIVTIAYGGDVFYGGAHGDYFGCGITYRKSDGKAFGTYDILDEDAWEQIQDKVAASLREFFQVDSNSELADEKICLGEFTR